MCSYGPQLPPGFKRQTEEEAKSSNVQEKSRTYGPSLPSHDDETAEETTSTAKRIIGPVIPQISTSSDASTVAKESRKRTVGPALPPGFPGSSSHSEDSVDRGGDDEDVDVGPSVSLMASEGDFSAAEQLARRMAKQEEKRKKAEAPQIQERESWMTDLPESLLGRNIAPALSTHSRTFKRRTDEYEADFAGWTSGPDKKSKKKSEEADSLDVLQYQQALEREKKLEEEIAKHNKSKRNEALTAMVQKQKKNSEQSGSGTERRPFDREKDLNIQKIGKLDQDELKKRAAALKDRFSSSSTSGQKFL